MRLILATLISRPFLIDSFTTFPCRFSQVHSFTSNRFALISKTQMVKRARDIDDEATSTFTSTTSPMPSPKKQTLSPKKKASPKKLKSADSPKSRSKSKSKSSPTKKKPPPNEKKEKTLKQAKEKKPKKPKVVIQSATEVDPLTYLPPTSPTAKYFTAVSWNCAGLRGTLAKNPDILSDLIKATATCAHGVNQPPDLIMLQETKLQEMHVDGSDKKIDLRNILSKEGYDDYWACSTAKKGYSGTAMFVRRSVPGKEKKQTDMSSFFGSSKETTKKEEAYSSKVKVKSQPVYPLPTTPPTYGFGGPGHASLAEGRTITLNYDKFTITNAYVPNAGQSLERLDYRTKTWDKDFYDFNKAQEKEKQKPVVWGGDLNVAYDKYDTWNEGAKHHPKQAGLTQVERDGFKKQLDDGGFKDAFRTLHGEKHGHYSYWSMRSGARAPNKGLRLDYFVCGEGMFEEEGGGGEGGVRVHNSFMVPEFQGSDHAPCVLELEIKY